MNKEEYLNKIFLKVLNELKLKLAVLNELKELKELKLEVLKELKKLKKLKELNELKSELNALNELIIKTPITYNSKDYYFKSQDGIIVYDDIYDDKLIKINYSYDLAIKSPVTADDNENLYLDIYNDIKTAIDEEKILQDMDEESLNLRNRTSSEVDIAKTLISKITETDDYKHFRFRKALKNLFEVAEILIFNINEDTVGGNKVYNGNRYMFPNTSLSVKYNSSIDKLKTTRAYLNSGQTLEKKNAETIIDIFSNLADASPYYYSYSSSVSSSYKNDLYEDVLKIVKEQATTRAAEEAAAAEAAAEEAVAAAAAAEEEAATAEEEAAAAAAAEEEAARAEAARARARAATARARAEAARAAEARAIAEAARAAEARATEEGGKGGGKRKSKGNSKKVSKKPVISQKKQSIYKEILGKQMKIYKMPDSRKEYVKYKGELLHISDYKDLMKQKAIAKTKTKATKATKVTQQKVIAKTKVTKETKATQQKAIAKTKTKATKITKVTKATQQKAIAKSKAKK